MRRNTLRLSTWILCLATALGAHGCRDEASTDDGADSGTEGTGASGSEGTGDETAAVDGTSTGGTPAVTFWDDVAPVLYESCVSCHREGGVAPFALDSYAQARDWSAAVAASVQARTMPPWLVTDDGSCGEFRYSRWLPQEHVDMIVAWNEGGAPEGEPRDDLAIPELPGLEGATEISTPNFFPEIQGGDLAEFDEYRCFLVDPQLPGDRFLTGYDVRPGNDAIVHHVLVMPVDPDLPVGEGITNADAMQALDDESPDREGWPCFGAAGEGVEVSGMPVVWAPGQGVVEFPEGTGLRISANEQLVIQLHYNLVDPANDGMSDQSAVQLRLVEEVEREGFMILPDPFLDSIFQGDPIELPPGESSVEHTWELPMSWLLDGSGLTSLDLFGVFPHMHAYGRAIHLEIDGPGGPECAADVPRWDFNWQLQYFYEEPRTLHIDDVLRVTCDFDTTAAEGPVLPGWGTYNEMCLMGMYLVP
jgi:Copper type II ascorbate-dependent monooxygenase, C-terminal domain